MLYRQFSFVLRNKWLHVIVLVIFLVLLLIIVQMDSYEKLQNENQYIINNSNQISNLSETDHPEVKLCFDCLSKIKVN